MKENPSLVHGQSEDTMDTRAVDAMRERLRDYRSLNKEIDNEIERLERMEMRITGVGSPVLSDMPKAPSTVYDRMADNVARKIDLEAEIKELIEQRDSERKAIAALTRKLKQVNERAVIRMRYLDNEDWEDIHSGYDYRVNAGDKISQLVILPVALVDLQRVDSLDDTERGNGGFGSTGR